MMNKCCLVDVRVELPLFGHLRICDTNVFNWDKSEPKDGHLGHLCICDKNVFNWDKSEPTDFYCTVMINVLLSSSSSVSL